MKGQQAIGIPTGTEIKGYWRSGLQCCRCTPLASSGLFELDEEAQALTSWRYWCRRCQHLVMTFEEAERALDNKALGAIGVIVAVPFPLERDADSLGQ